MGNSDGPKSDTFSLHEQADSWQDYFGGPERMKRDIDKGKRRFLEISGMSAAVLSGVTLLGACSKLEPMKAGQAGYTPSERSESPIYLDPISCVCNSISIASASDSEISSESLSRINSARSFCEIPLSTWASAMAAS